MLSSYIVPDFYFLELPFYSSKKEANLLQLLIAISSLFSFSLFIVISDKKV